MSDFLTEKNNIAEVIYQKMLQNIIDKTWEENDKLPTEFELTEMFNVSRTSIRSAVQKLRDKGIIYTKHGRGSFVSSGIDTQSILTSEKPIMHLSKTEFLDMMVFRQTIEFKCIELAVENATSEDIARIEDALNRMLVNKNDYKKYSVADLDFHIAIARASHNIIFVKIMNDIKDIYYFYLEELNRVLGITLESIDAHIQIFMAIKDKNIDIAKHSLNEAMKTNEVAIRKIES